MDKSKLELNLDDLKADDPFDMADDADKQAAGEGKLISIILVDLNNREINMKVSAYFKRY